MYRVPKVRLIPELYLSFQDFLSDYPISFHYITPEQMYELDYYLYHFHPYGGVH